MENLKNMAALYNRMCNEPPQTFDTVMHFFYSRYLKPGDVAIDVGANTGSHTIQMAKQVGPEGQVLAFEPVQENLAVLKKSTYNQGLTSIISTHEIALSNHSGESDFYVFTHRPGMSCLKMNPEGESVEPEYEIREVITKTLDDLTAEIQRVDLIKIDTEGAEFSILLGARKIIENQRPVIFFECWQEKYKVAELYNYSKEEFFEFFQSMNYQLYELAGQVLQPHHWETRTLIDLMAIPVEREEEVLESLRLSILQTLGESYKISINTNDLPMRSREDINKIGKKKWRLIKKVEELFKDSPSFHGSPDTGSQNFSMMPDVLHWIYRSLKPGSLTLEIGCGYSTVVFALLSGHHTVISPYIEEYKLIQKWCKAHKVSLDYVKFINENSQDITPHMQMDQILDLILIDGNRAFPIPSMDWYYTAEWLKKEGMLILVGKSIYTVSLMCEFLEADQQKWQAIYQDGNTTIFQKKSASPVVKGIPWTHQPYMFLHSDIDMKFKQDLPLP